jgi:autotransporter translocation and assembly factor TamB
LSGLVTLKGNANAVKDVKATIDLSDLQLFYQKAALIQAKAIKARVAHGTLSTAGIELTLLTGGLLELKGSATIDGPIDLACHTRIPLADVGPFVEDLSDITGSVELTGRIVGTFSRPDFEGRLDLSDIGLTVPVLLQKVHDLKGRIAISKGALRFESLSGFLDTGRFAAKGQMAYEGLQLQEIHLTLDADALPLELPDTLSVLLNSRLTLDGEPEKCETKGEIVMLEGVYFKEVKFNLFDAVSKPKRTVEAPKAPLTVAFLKNMLLDIAVRNRDPLLIQNNLADLELKPDLHLGGSLNNPVIDGRAKVQSGSMYFQKKTFEVQKGVIDFVNPYKTEAEIDIVGETQVRSWKIILGLKGSPDDLLLTLTSVPEESNSDILSLLLFGKTGHELASGQGSGKRSTSQIMTEMLADAFSSDLKETAGVDILELESTDGQDSESAGGLKVTLGKHLSQRMTVKYSVETKDGESIQRAISEYKFLEHILASGFQDTQGVYGGELVFRIEFR